MRFSYWVWRYKKYLPFTQGGKHYRKLPVPHTRCYRGSVQYFRRPKTLQELRYIDALCHDDDMRDLKVKIRAQRKKIPTQWDDQWLYHQRSWKKYRKHQWKAK